MATSAGRPLDIHLMLWPHQVNDQVQVFHPQCAQICHLPVHYSNRKCCIVQTGIFSLTYQCNKYNLLKTWVVFHWTGAVLEAVLLAHRFNPLINPVSETFSSRQCCNPVISKDFDILKKKIPGHVTKWNPPSFFRFRQLNRDRDSGMVSPDSPIRFQFHL